METGKLTHSQSQPGGMDRTPPSTPKKGGKMLAIRVQMLDDTVTMFQVQAKALGRVLFDQVCSQLHLLESDYFGLEYQEVGGTKYWLDLEKPISRQIGLSLVDTLVRFCVKFYTPDPSQLEEEFTRYLFCLQIKRDLSQGLLQCNNNTAALLASYIVQAECGDYVAEDYPDYRYLSSYKFVPNQDPELEKRIMENHKKHAGQSPAEADLNLLETARRCELYGIKMHAAKDHEGVPLNLAVAHMGIVVFQNFTKINTFSWAKIRKISFKRKRFLVKLHPEGYGYYKDTVEFFFEGRNECKNFWKKCVENHGFFRCTSVKKVPRQKTRVLSRGSSFRYSGRTQKQIVNFVRENYVKRQVFQRSQSFRHSSSAHTSVANVGTSISAHPLLPLGENAVVGTPASLSCGSMTLTSSPIHAADIHIGSLPSPHAITSGSPGTSITSSPQHFYPQENLYARAGHQRAKVTNSRDHSHHGVSPPQGPINAVTPVNTHSVNHSNNNLDNLIFENGDAKNDRMFSDANFNDLYSNCYDSLKNLHNNSNRSDFNHNKMKFDEVSSDINGHFLNGTSKSNESIRSSIKMSQREQEYDWHRSASFKDLYIEDDSSSENKNFKNIKENHPTYYDSLPRCRFDRDSAIAWPEHKSFVKNGFSSSSSKASENEDRKNGVLNDLKMHSNSYPGTTNSLLIECTDEKAQDTLNNYDSLGELVLSHDDVSHDSYELLEKDPNELNDEVQKRRSRRISRESDRARSCSWGSDGGRSLLNFRSTENVLFMGDDKSNEDGCWYLEPERNLNHKSEGDFRSLDMKSLRKLRTNERNDINRSVVPINKMSRYRDSNADEFECTSNREGVFDVLNSNKQMEPEILTPKKLAERECLKLLKREPWIYSKRDNYDQDHKSNPERTKYQVRKKSLEKCQPFLMRVESNDRFAKEKQYRSEERKKVEKLQEKTEERFHEGLRQKESRDWENEKEMRQLERKKILEDKIQNDIMDKEIRITSALSAKNYTEFKEIHPKKFDRVVSNQFGEYSEFLTQEKKYDILKHEKKVMENYEKVCQVGKLAKELEMRERYGQKESESKNIITRNGQKENQKIKIEKSIFDYEKFPQFSKVQEENKRSNSDKANSVYNFQSVISSGSKITVERTKSDPFSMRGNLRRNVLTHQKSIDLTPQQSSEEVVPFSQVSDSDRFSKTSRSEDDIPYILHKRHMNGTSKKFDPIDSKTDTKSTPLEESRMINDESLTEDEDPLYEIIDAKKTLPKDNDGPKVLPKTVNQEPEMEKISQIKGVDNVKKVVQPLYAKPPIGKKHEIYRDFEEKIVASDLALLKESKKVEALNLDESANALLAKKTELKDSHDKSVNQQPAEEDEPMYAKVYKGKIIDKKPVDAPPLPPERTTSMQKKYQKDGFSDPTKLQREMHKSGETQNYTFVQSKQTILCDSSNISIPSNVLSPSRKDCEPIKPASSSSNVEHTEEASKTQPIFSKNTGDGARHKESLISFAKSRLGLSEGSAFTPVRIKTSPTNQRRAKSLDSPYISLNRLPPANAFSSKDDTLDANEDNVLPLIERVSDTIKKDAKALILSNNLQVSKISIGKNVNKTVESEPKTSNQSKMRNYIKGRYNVELSEDKTFEGIRNKRLLSKIESVDGADSEGDMDSSKLTDAPPIPSDRLVNLPESVRFPSVRQISGQTSEESADGWEQKEVKVKRRTPRRSVGREEPEMKESVVWDSKDDEHPDDDVWDDSLIFTGKFEGCLLTDAIAPIEYLKRGSCGQSIDDDNLSTPMKESSPEHWISVDDLPEAIEREERFLRKQEEILREKILNEKLKRELNLDAVGVNGKLYEYKMTRMQIQKEKSSIDIKDKFKSYSLDAYGLTEKKIEEKGTNKYLSLDEHILREKPIKNYVTIPSNFDDSDSISSDKWSAFPHQNLDYVQYQVVNDFREIQFGTDNDEELEEFFVVFDEKSENEKDEKNLYWNGEDGFVRTSSKDESVISVPEEFRDDSDLPEVESLKKDEVPAESANSEKFTLKGSNEDRTFLTLKKVADEIGNLYQREEGTKIKISSKEESRRSSVDMKKLSLVEESDRLSPYEYSFRRNSNEPDRLSPLNDSRLGGNDSRRLSSEDSRKYSISESVSEETRRRLSSTEETRRKRASLTKQCSVGADSLTDEMVSGVPECNSSFEHDDEKDVFEVEDSGVKSFETRNELKMATNESGTHIENENNSQNETVKSLGERMSAAPIIVETEPKIILDEFDDNNFDLKKEEILEKPEIPQINWEPEFLVENTNAKTNEEVSWVKGTSMSFLPVSDPQYQPSVPYKNNYDSSQDSDIDKLSEISLISYVQNQISRRNLSETGKCLRTDGMEVVESGNLNSVDGSDGKTSSEERGFGSETRYSSEDLERTESSSFEGKPSPENEGKRMFKKFVLRGPGEPEKIKTDARIKVKDRKTQEEKRDSGEDGSSSSSAPFHPKRELSSTWKPFLLESSGSSSLEENWLPPDDNAHLADEEETSNTSQQDESGQEDLNYPTGVGYTVMNVSSAEMIVGGYSGTFALSRTLSRISERSTSEQERSDVEDEFTKLSSHSMSAEEESMLSSDPGSLRGSAARIPDLPDDRSFVSDIGSNEKKAICEPFEGIIPPPLPDEDWTSISNSGGLDSPVGMNHHVETVYLEIYPEEARKVIVTEPYYNEGNSSSDENQTLHEEGEFLHLSSDNVSLSTTTTTTQDGTVVPISRKSARAGSFSEDASTISISERSSSTTPKSRTNSTFGLSDDFSERSKFGVLKSGSASWVRDSEATPKHEPEISKIAVKIKPPKLKSPTGKIGFFETPTSKVRSPLSQTKFFDVEDPHPSSFSRSPTSRSESSSPKNPKRFFESPVHRVLNYLDAYENHGSRNISRLDPCVPAPVSYSQSSKGIRSPHYYNVDDSAEKSFFGRYDTGSLERTKINNVRKCRSSYSMTKNQPDDEDSSNSDEYRVPFSNTIPRASKKKRRHRVAMDLEIRDGKMVAPPKTRAVVIDNTDSDRSSPRQFSPKEKRKRHSEV